MYVLCSLFRGLALCLHICLLYKCIQDSNGCNCWRIGGIVSATTKAIPINQILNLIWMFWQFHYFMWFIMSDVWQGWYVIVLPLFFLLSFIVFISTRCLFMTYQSTTPWSWKNQREQRGRMKENQERWGWQRSDHKSGGDITAKKEREYVKKRERMWGRMRNKNERKKKENKDRRGRVRCGPFISRLLQGISGQHTCYYSLQRK